MGRLAGSQNPLNCRKLGWWGGQTLPGAKRLRETQDEFGLEARSCGEQRSQWRWDGGTVGQSAVEQWDSGTVGQWDEGETQRELRPPVEEAGASAAVSVSMAATKAMMGPVLMTISGICYFIAELIAVPIQG